MIDSNITIMHLFFTMNKNSKKRVVLIGGGHANIQVLHGLADWKRSLFDLTLISDSQQAPYSGMIPSYLAGEYDTAQLQFDLKKICERYGFQFLQGSVTSLNAASQTISLDSGHETQYDLASLNVGIQPVTLPSLHPENMILIKPISGLIKKWASLIHLAKNSNLNVVGGGAGAFEIAVACAVRFQKESHQIQLITGQQGLLPTLNPIAQKLARATLKKLNIRVFEGSRVRQLQDQTLRLENGASISSTVSLIATTAGAPAWFKTTDLPLNREGFVQVQSNLLVKGQSQLFAAGDCCEFLSEHLPKAGVYAVRQGPILIENLKAQILGLPLKAYQPQKDFLMILITGKKRALACKGSWAFEGRLPWLLKNWIDLRFMNRFR